MRNKRSLKGSLICVIFLLFVLQNPLQEVATPFSFFDEMITIGAMFWSLIKFSNKFKKTRLVESWRFKVVVTSFIIMMLGLLGNLIFQIQKIEYVFIDVVSFLKFFTPLFLGLTFTVDQIDCKTQRTISRICKVLLTVQLLLVVHDELFTPWFPYLSDYGRMRSLRLYYSNQTYLVAYSVFLIGVIMCFEGVTKNKFYLFAATICVLSSMRSKAFGFVAVMLILSGVIRKIKIKRPVLLGVLISPIILYVVKDKVILYFFTESHFSPRKMILEEGLKISLKYFPLGAGFGTYCSPGANLGNSPLYDVFGDYFQYMVESITDLYWGSLLGQVGIIGVFLYGYILVVVLKKVWSAQTVDKKMFFSGIGFLLYLIIASIGELSFASTYVIGYAFFIGLIINSCKKVEGKHEKDFTNF